MRDSHQELEIQYKYEKEIHEHKYEYEYGVYKSGVSKVSQISLKHFRL